MGIRVHDSLARKTVDLQPRDAGKIAMYVCGPTVYNYIHIGNARTFLSFDLIRRYLRYRGFEVTYVMNYTDVDDKIIERAKIEGIPTDGVTQKYSRAFEDDMAALGTDMADVIVKATEHIEDMVEAIEGPVMSMKYLGAGLDIHGGGSDLIFPHHENEIAQAGGLSEPPFVRHWLH